MYDELVKRLRAYAGLEWHFRHISKQAYEMIKEAANVIEVMSEYINIMRRLKSEGWHLQQTKFHDGYQAVATMPLPEPPKEE